MKPQRIQRKREKGWKLKDHCTNPLGYVIISRPHALGNPFDWTNFVNENRTPEEAKARAVMLFRTWLIDGIGLDVNGARAQYLANLELHRGKDPVCWCSLDSPYCHAVPIIEWWEATA